MSQTVTRRDDRSVVPRPRLDVRQLDGSDRRVGVVGLGYVGLPTALALAAAGHSVTGVDTSRERLAAIAAGDVDLLPQDHDRLNRHSRDASVVTSDDLSLLAGMDVVMICVPTPVDHHQTPDLATLRAACRAVVSNACQGQVIILTSTSYAGCTRDMLIDPLTARGLSVGLDVHVAFSPERIDPANSEFPTDRVTRVVGGATEACTRRAASILARVVPTVHSVSTPEAAELTKLYENTFRAVNIALANEMADVATSLGVAPMEIVTAAATKPFGFLPFSPGPGVGGHCIPCDPHYLLWQLRAKRLRTPLIEEAMAGIAGRPNRVVERATEVLAATGRALTGSRVLVHGVAYKPGVADVRESPALEILSRLEGRGAATDYYDSRVPELHIGGVRLQSIERPSGAGHDLVIVHTVHPQDDTSWLQGVSLLLDATYRLGLSQAHLV